MISVLLPYRDAEATLREAIESVLADMAPSDELIAIDDGSRDASAALVLALASRDARIRRITSSVAGDESVLALAFVRREVPDDAVLSHGSRSATQLHSPSPRP